MTVRSLSTQRRPFNFTKHNPKQANPSQHNGTQPKRRPQFQAICTDCGNPTTVPFRQTSSRRMAYCPPCFKSHRNSRTPAPSTPPVNKTFTAKAPRTDDAAAHADVFPGMELKPATRAAIAKMNISKPTPIQEKTIPHLMEGRDLIGQARTGSGKTLAFAVPLTEQCDPSVRRVQALVLTPTRELAIQVAGVTDALASPQRLRLTMLYGGPFAEARLHCIKEWELRSSLGLRAVRWTIFGRALWTCGRCDSWCWMRRTRCWIGVLPTT